MNIQVGSAGIDGTWWVLLFAGAELTTTHHVPVVTPREGTWASTPMPATFDEHLASLPTLQDLLARSQAADPNFERELTRAREGMYKRLLREVRKGKMTRLAAERLRCRLTQAELADRVGMKQPNISRLEQVGVVMTVSTAKRLAEVLELDDYRVLLP